MISCSIRWKTTYVLLYFKYLNSRWLLLSKASHLCAFMLTRNGNLCILYASHFEHWHLDCKLYSLFLWLESLLKQAHICNWFSPIADWRCTEWSTRWRECILWLLLLLCCETWSVHGGCNFIPCKCCIWHFVLHFLNWKKEW